MTKKKKSKILNHKSSISFWHPASLFATSFGLGRIHFAPGTFGSLAGILFFLSLYIWDFFMPKYIAVMLFILFVVLATRITSIYCGITKRQDPGEVVIDEIAGQALTYGSALYLLDFISNYFPKTPYQIGDSTVIYENYAAMNGPEFIWFLVGGFILFRVFDIIKPWPVSWFDENIKGGWGVMADDLVAGLLAGVVTALMILVI